MNYFTPELLARTRSVDDNEAEAATCEWEQHIAAYNARLAQMRRQLPLGVRQLLRRVSLHDAQLLTLNRAGSELFLTFRLAANAGKQAGGVELRYRLAGQSKLILHEPQRPPNGPVSRWVLYDEFAETRGAGVRAYTHSLLMTGGLEFRIRFANLRLRQFGMVLLADSKPSEIQKELASDDQRATA